MQKDFVSWRNIIESLCNEPLKVIYGVVVWAPSGKKHLHILVINTDIEHMNTITKNQAKSQQKI